MSNELEMAAKILVECGYSEGRVDDGVSSELLYWEVQGGDDVLDHYELVEPFSDTLEGRRQADAIEDWLLRQESDIYRDSTTLTGLYSGHTLYQHRLYRIKWCLEQLAGDEK